MGIEIGVAWDGESEDDVGGASGENGAPGELTARPRAVRTKYVSYAAGRDSGSGEVGLINQNSSISALDECLIE